MQVILLAAGQSKRLHPLHDKNQLEFLGRTLLEHQVAAIKAAKLRDIVVVANAGNKDAFKAMLKKYNNVAVVEQKDLKDGMAGGVLAGSTHIKHKNVLVMACNDVFDGWLFEKIVEASKKPVDAVIAAKKVESYFPGGYLKTNDDGLVTDIVEKPAPGKEPSKWVNLVVHAYNDFPAFLKYLKAAKSKKDDRYETALSDYIKKGKAQVAPFKFLGEWTPLKYPWHVLSAAERYLLAAAKGSPKGRIARGCKIAKSATLTGAVFLEEGVQVMGNATLIGPLYVGKNTIIGTNALVRESMIGSHGVIGFGTEVARSYLNHHVWTHTNYVGDSVVDSNVSFGAGTVLANLRFDEANVKMNIGKERVDTGTPKFGAVVGHGARLGVNSSVLPGMKVGQNAFVGPNVAVDRDVEDNQMVTLKTVWTVAKNTVGADTGKRRAPGAR